VGIVAVTHDDVRSIAGLARLTVPEERLEVVVAELNGILGHMEVLARVEGKGAAEAAENAAAGMHLAPDAGPPVGLEAAISHLAPACRDGFFLVPRLSTHGALGSSAEDVE